MSESGERELQDDNTGLRMLLTETTAERDQLQARIDAYEGRLEAWEEMDRLISQSSLGTPEAVALRERTPPEVARAIVRASEYLGRAEEAEAERDQVRAVVEAGRPLLALFVRFVRMNPGLADDDSAIARAFDAYRVALAQLDASGEATGG